ncbi:hypothetical protein Aca07nite_28030 [Actinoplanes capillaceus]|uniref:Helix-turn-helix domain-containing protein n=2 Tax=Actinoplanes campanulatus TaxID=113559 RepID=A0ABQ3WH16_9ACTN|nr:hypothetical protein Aca07nite_28030 [Actinoplanes capillaceus]
MAQRGSQRAAVRASADVARPPRPERNSPANDSLRATQHTPPVHRLGRPDPMASNFLTLADFLAELDVPKSTFFRWKALGEAPRTYKLPNGQLRIRRTDFDAWLSSREEPQAA